MSNCGQQDDHCCYIGEAGVCPFLVENQAGRRWACSLMIELGDWNLVHSDQRYLDQVKPHWIERGIVDCGDWPREGKTCPVCGQVGS